MKAVGRPPKPLIDRFTSKFIPVPESGCWLWAGASDLDGYGFIKRKDGKQLRAHRVAYEHFNGEIPEGYYVLHKCDVPCCVNPNHLWVGTNQENMDDKVSKDRTAKLAGELNPMYGKPSKWKGIPNKLRYKQ